MTERITSRMLSFALERLNAGTKCKYKIGSSYGYYNLERASMECTGIDSISMGNTKKELYYQIQTFLKIKEAEKNRKADFIKNCTHHDVFNLHYLKDNDMVNHAHIFKSEIKKKYQKLITYQCLTCKKFFRKSEYEENQRPKSRDELIKMRVRE